MIHSSDIVIPILCPLQFSSPSELEFYPYQQLYVGKLAAPTEMMVLISGALNSGGDITLRAFNIYGALRKTYLFEKQVLSSGQYYAKGYLTPADFNTGEILTFKLFGGDTLLADSVYYEANPRYTKDLKTITFSNSINDWNTVFGVFSITVECGFNPNDFKAKGAKEDFQDQNYLNEIVFSQPYATEVLTVGGTQGIPNWLYEKINGILMCSSIDIVGVNYEVAAGATFDKIDQTYAGLARYGIELQKSDNFVQLNPSDPEAPSTDYIGDIDALPSIETPLGVSHTVVRENGINYKWSIENMLSFFAATIDPNVLDAAVRRYTSGVQKGMTVGWDLNLGAIPTGFVLADGNNGEKINGVTILDERGKFSVGYDPASSKLLADDFNYGAVGNTGGEDEHILTTGELPAHDHHTAGFNQLLWKDPMGGGSGKYFDTTQGEPDLLHSATISSVGGGQAHENRPRYIVKCYITKVADDVVVAGDIMKIVAGRGINIDATDARNPIVSAEVYGTVVKTITAGDNIDVSVDPLDSTHLIISGVGGGTTLTADQLQIINTVPLVCSDEKTDLTASTDVPVIRFVFQTAQSFTKIVGELNTAAAGGTLTVVAKKNGVSFLSTNLTFDGGENTTRTAAVPFVFTTPTVSFSVGDYVEIFVTTIGAVTPGKGLKIYLM